MWVKVSVKIKILFALIDRNVFVWSDGFRTNDAYIFIAGVKVWKPNNMEVRLYALACENYRIFDQHGERENP